jgi:hypothetical protein
MALEHCTYHAEVFFSRRDARHHVYSRCHCTAQRFKLDYLLTGCCFFEVLFRCVPLAREVMSVQQLFG